MAESIDELTDLTYESLLEDMIQTLKEGTEEGLTYRQIVEELLGILADYGVVDYDG